MFSPAVNKAKNENSVEKSGTINLFVTSKNETTNSPIYQFKVLRKCVKNEKARFKMFFKVINKK